MSRDSGTADLDNPYWEAVRDHVSTDDRFFAWEGPQIARWDMDGGRLEIEGYPQREDLVARYAWAVTDPASVEFVAAMTFPDGLIDPMAGTGYWAYVLGQLGVDVVCYDSSPPGETHNQWHQDNPCWVPVAPGFAEVVVDDHPDRVLFLCWPPYSEPSAARVLREYKGHRVIVVGESSGGCTGDEDFHERLESDWIEIAEHVPVQWWGLHDRITVYERKADSACPANPSALSSDADGPTRGPETIGD